MCERQRGARRSLAGDERLQLVAGISQRVHQRPRSGDRSDALLKDCRVFAGEQLPNARGDLLVEEAGFVFHAGSAEGEQGRDDMQLVPFALVCAMTERADAEAGFARRRLLPNLATMLRSSQGGAPSNPLIRAENLVNACPVGQAGAP